jgi:hypothetical protein
MTEAGGRDGDAVIQVRDVGLQWDIAPVLVLAAHNVGGTWCCGRKPATITTCVLIDLIIDDTMPGMANQFFGGF